LTLKTETQILNGLSTNKKPKIDEIEPPIIKHRFGMQTNAELYLVGVIIDFRNLQTCVQFSHMLPRNVFILLGELRGDDTSYHLI